MVHDIRETRLGKAACQPTIRGEVQPLRWRRIYLHNFPEITKITNIIKASGIQF